MNESQNKPHWNCEGCKKTIPQGEEQKIPHYYLTPQSPSSHIAYNSYQDTQGKPYEIKPFDRVERIKLHLMCSPCSKTQEQQNQQLLDERNPRRPIVNPNVVVENSAIVDYFDRKLSEQSLKQILQEDWDERLKRDKKPWEHQGNKS